MAVEVEGVYGIPRAAKIKCSKKGSSKKSAQDVPDLKEGFEYSTGLSNQS